MRKVIAGSVYDTNLAPKIGEYDNGFFTVALHKTRARKYFFWRDKYDVFSEQILPASLEEAKVWAAEHLSAEAFDEVFGEPKDGKQLKGFRLSNDAVKALEGMQAERGGSLSAIVESLIMDCE